MTSLHRAINANYVATDSAGVATYTGLVDPHWTIGSVPNGGYVIALILEACMQHQSSTKHPDPLHTTAHFLSPTSVHEPFNVQIRVIKQGRSFTNLIADLAQPQSGGLKVTTHMIFGVLKESDNSSPLTLAPPSVFARRIPLSQHPASVSVTGSPRPPGAYTFAPSVHFSTDRQLEARNTVEGRLSAKAGDGGLEWGSWLTFKDPETHITPQALPFLLDISLTLPSLLPESEGKHGRKSWFPTLVLSIEFKSPIPKFSENLFSPHTVGIYAKSLFMNEPQGRTDTYCEVWTAPSDIGKGQQVEGWRDSQRCLATLTQMALTVPMEVNRSKGMQKPKL